MLRKHMHIRSGVGVLWGWGEPLLTVLVPTGKVGGGSGDITTQSTLQRPLPSPLPSPRLTAVGTSGQSTLFGGRRSQAGGHWNCGPLNASSGIPGHSSPACSFGLTGCSQPCAGGRQTASFSGQAQGTSRLLSDSPASCLGPHTLGLWLTQFPKRT